PWRIPAPASSPTGGPRFYSPLVLNIAGKEGVSMAELETIPGTGNEGRVTKKVMLQYIEARKSGAAAAAPAQTAAPTPAPAAAPRPAAPAKPASSTAPVSGNVEIIEMARMRTLIAEHMVRSKATSPHVTSFMEADVTNMVNWRNRVKGEFERKYGEKITYTPIFIEAIVNCIRRFPMINASLDGDRIIVKKDINIGMATALPTGNLIVPVIKHADTRNLLGLSKEVNALAQSARKSRLKADDTQGGTFTLTNVGTFGSLMGT